MKKRLLVAAAALLIFATGSAEAADDSERSSQNAQKIIATLNMLDINDKGFQDFIVEHNERVDNRNSMSLASETIAGGTWSLNYSPSAIMPTGKQLELHYAPSDSNINVVAKTDNVEVRYRLAF